MLMNWLAGVRKSLANRSRRLGSRSRRRPIVVSNAAPAEVFEMRQYPAATLIATLSATGALTIEGTNGNDNINVRQISNAISVDGIKITKAGVLVNSVAASAVTSITVNGLGGNDTINLDSAAVTGQQAITKPTTLNGGAGNDVVIGSAGNDNILGDIGDDLLTGGLGNDILNGGVGTDRLEETANVATLTLTNTRLSGIGTDTVSGIEQANLTGGASANRLDASTFTGSVTLSGLGGNDTLLGGSGADVLQGGDANDSMNGGAGIDRVIESGNVNFTLTNTQLTGAGTDVLANIEQASLTGGTGNNLLTAASFTGAVTLSGGDGNDTLTGGNANDVLDGGIGIDQVMASGNVNFTLTNTQLQGLGTDTLANIEQANLTGGISNNQLTAFGFTGSVTLMGGDGNDTLIGGNANDSLDGGTGIDQVFALGNVNFMLTNTQLTGVGTDTLANIEQANLIGGAGNNTLDASSFSGPVTLAGGDGDDMLIGGSSNDMLIGGDGSDEVDGNGGDDLLLGGGGMDFLSGGSGKDTISGGEGDDFLWGEDGDDSLSGDAGNDQINGNAGNDTVDAGSGNDWFYGDEGDDSLTGGDGSDHIDGGDGNDTLDGGIGLDTLTGGLGDDQLDGGADIDQVVESGDVDFTLSDTLLIGLGTDTLANIEQANLAGGAGSNILDASSFSGPVTLDGGDGSDMLIGGSGNDRLQGGNDDDVLVGLAGNDTLLGGGGNDSLRAVDGTGRDQLFGEAGDDTFETDLGDQFDGDGADQVVMASSATTVTTVGHQKIINPLPTNNPIYATLAVQSVGMVTTAHGIGSGTLIDPNHVLTAAHLVVDPSTGSIFRPTFSLNGTVYQARRVFVHPGYAQAEQNDLAIIELVTPDTHDTPTPIARFQPISNESVLLVGYGQTGTTGQLMPSDNPNHIRLAALTKLDGGISGTTISWTVDSQFEGGNAHGDSGGGNFILRNNRWYVAGVTRDGTDPATQVGAFNESTRVDAYTDWIDSIVGGFILQTGTVLHETDASFTFIAYDWNRDGRMDLVAIKKSGTGTHSTEIHVLDGATNFQSYLLHAGTALPETDGTFEFDMGDWNRDGHPDLIAFKKSGTGTHSTEVHILDGATNYQSWLLHTGTVLEESGSNFELKAIDWNRDGRLDLVAIKKNGTGTGSTEVHVLDGAANFQTFILHTGTPLQETGTDFDFDVSDYDGDGIPDLVAVQKRATGTLSTELHVLSGASQFHNFIAHKATGLAETGDNFEFEYAGKLIAIKKNGTGTGTTEVHIPLTIEGPISVWR